MLRKAASVSFIFFVSIASAAHAQEESSPEAGGFTATLKIPGIAKFAPGAKLNQNIDILSYSTGVTYGRESGTRENKHSPKPRLQAAELNVVKKFDAFTPILWELVAKQTVLPTVELHLVSKGKSKERSIIKIHNVRLLANRPGGAGGGSDESIGLEEINMSYERIDMSFEDKNTKSAIQNLSLGKE